MKKNIVFILLVLCLKYSIADERLDGIVAIVDNEIILLSELNAYTALRINSMGVSGESVDTAKLKKEFLNELIEGKVLIAYGKKDSMISVTEEEVEQAAANHINTIIKENHLTPDSLDAELRRQQGITLSKFKVEIKKAIKEQLYKQKLQQMYLSTVKLTKKEVAAFYEEYKDSLPKVGESILLSKLSLKISPSDVVRQKAFEKIKAIKTQLDNGADFVEMAKKYSESLEASNGGDLGFIEKGTLNELAFEEKAFSLPVGVISEPFETRLGFHIIKVLEKRDQKVHVCQIFTKVEPTPEELSRVKNKIDSIRTSCKTKEDFVNAVKKFSDDPSSKASNGIMPWYVILELPSEIRAAVDNLPIGAISEPVISDKFISIYRVEDRVKERQLTLENDYSIIEKKAMEIKAQKRLRELVAQWRNKIYIDIKL
ncbi:MAG: peptidylprolyl isomerase [Chitinispirillaceae bacterium]|nr:peptidylprolyl isomerase [Chitinispirillaceae bacterium]